MDNNLDKIELFPLDEHTKMFVHFCMVYKTKRINHKKFLAIIREIFTISPKMFANIQTGIYIEKNYGIYKSLPNYKCSLTGWHNDRSKYDIWSDYLDKTLVRSITFNELLECTQILLGQKKNYCKDWILHEIVKPISRYYPKLGISSYEHYEYSGSYCCTDCDGDYESFKESDYNHYIDMLFLKTDDLRRKF